MYSYYGYPMMYYGFDWTYILVLIGALLSIAASHNVQATFEKFARVQSFSGLTGAQAAQMILERNNITNVKIQGISGNLTDNYVPSRKILNLSQSTINSTSIAAIGVAAHECGHAIQDDTDYVPLRIRAALVPVANIGAQASWPLILIGILLANFGSAFGLQLLNIGIMAFSLAVLFQIVTLPVEFDASNRALRQLDSMNLVPDQELPYARKVLGAAALTYVASAAASLLQLLRLYLLFGGRRRRD